MDTNNKVRFNVLLHGLDGEYSDIVNRYDWFQTSMNPEATQTPATIIVAALDNVMSCFGNVLPIGACRGAGSSTATTS